MERTRLKGELCKHPRVGTGEFPGESLELSEYPRMDPSPTVLHAGHSLLTILRRSFGESAEDNFGELVEDILSGEVPGECDERNP